MLYAVGANHQALKIRMPDGLVLWRATLLPEIVFPGMNVVLAKDIVAMSRVDIVAHDTATGAFRWRYTGQNDEPGRHAIAVSDSILFSGSLHGNVHAVRASNGTARWVRDLSLGGTNVGAFGPIVHSGTVFVCTKDFDASPQRGTFWALDELTGAIRWSRTLVPADPSLSSGCIGSTVAWANLVIQPQEDGRIFAYDMATGDVVWSTPLLNPVGTFGWDVREAAVSGDVLIVTSSARAGAVVAYDAATGNELWRQTEWGGSDFRPAVDAEVVAIDHGWTFASYDLRTGTQRWANPTSVQGRETDFKGTAILAGDRMFVVGRRAVYALRR